MSRSVSLTLREAVNAEQTGEVFVFLMTFTHASLADPILISSDPTERLTTDPLVYGTVSRGDNYSFLPVRIALPDDSDDSPPMIRLTLDNVYRDLIPLLRSISTKAKATVEVVLASDPDTVEISLPEFDVSAFEANGSTIMLSLTLDAMTAEPYPAGTITPSAFGGLF